MRAEALLDRIVRGRAWIPVLGVALIGIVAMQVEVLKLGASAGRSMNRVTELSGQLQIERAQVSSLDSPARIMALATTYGLAEPGPTDNHFIPAGTSVRKAIAGIHSVDRASFDANLLREQSVDDDTSSQAAGSADAQPGTTLDSADATATLSTASAAATGSDGTSAAGATSSAPDAPVTAADPPTTDTAAPTTAAPTTDPTTAPTAVDPTAADPTAAAADPTSAGSPTTGGSALSGVTAGAVSSSSSIDN